MLYYGLLWTADKQTNSQCAISPSEDLHKQNFALWRRIVEVFRAVLVSKQGFFWFDNRGERLGK